MNENSAFALKDTLAVYGISRNPFPIDETDDFFFSTPTLLKQFEVLRNLVEYGELLLVVSGVEGAGKSTFINQFLLAPDANWKFCRVAAGDAATRESLVDALLDGFGLNARGNDAHDGEVLLRAHLAEVHAEGGIAVVAVDDAHLLPQICTDFLLGLFRERQDMELRLLLGTEPGRLGFATDDPKRVHVVVVQPFDTQQCGEYIHTRLSRAGLGGDSPFDTRAVEAIHQDSGGVPGTIHSLALHALLASTDTRRLSQPRGRVPRAAVYLLAALAVAGAAAVFMRPEPGPSPLAGVGGLADDPLADDKLRGPIAGPGADAGAPSPVLDAASQPRQEATSGAFSGNITARGPAQAAGKSADAVEVLIGDGAKVFALDEHPTGARPALAVDSPAAIKSAPAGAPAAPLAGNVTPAAAVTAKSGAAHGLGWLRGQDPAHYVIQLVGTRDRKAADAFVVKHALGAEAASFATTHENKPWYVVVYGLYPDGASARAAIATLPERLRAGSPWPRSVASVLASAR